MVIRDRSLISTERTTMKSLIIILLSLTGLEDLKYPIKPGLTCEEHAAMWRETHVTYHESRTADPKLQGYYTPDGKLFVGYYCK
jgi:hypothetical protein